MNEPGQEYRFDPVRREWVILAPARARRPRGVVTGGLWHEAGPCPFCPGNESHTPPEILALRPDGSEADTPGWRVRVVPNRYPAVVLDATSPDGEPQHRPGALRIAGYGSHEVVIETPDHAATMTVQSVESVLLTLKIFRARLRTLSANRRLLHVQIFKNSGHAAGATREHPHWQIVATATLPAAVASELRALREYRDRQDRCVVCERIETELDEGARLVHRNDHFISFCPYASRLPFEMCIAPIRHAPDYAESSDEELLELADILKRTVGSLARVARDPAFNLVLHTTPSEAARASVAATGSAADIDFHWRLELLPRMANLAGFEWGTGMYINHLAPEEAARALRDGAPAQ